MPQSILTCMTGEQIANICPRRYREFINILPKRLSLRTVARIISGGDPGRMDPVLCALIRERITALGDEFARKTSMSLSLEPVSNPRGGGPRAAWCVQGAWQLTPTAAHLFACHGSYCRLAVRPER